MDIFHNKKQYFSVDKKEFKHFLITSVVLGFVFSFTEWGTATFSVSQGIISLINASLVVLLSLLIRISLQKLTAVYMGYKISYSAWPLGLAIAVLLAVILNGKILFFAVPGVLAFALIEHMRVGKPKQAMMLSDQAVISAVGIFSSLVLAFIFQGFTSFTANPLVAKLALVNAWLALVSVLPIPNLDGFRIFYYSRTFGLFAVIMVVSAVILLQTTSFVQAMLFALGLAFAVAVVYFVKFELSK